MRAILAAAAMLAATFGALPAAAQNATYNSFNTFDGAQGAGNFTYGELDRNVPGSGTLFAANSNCFISGSICLQREPAFDVPGFTKSTTESFQYGTVNVPRDRLLAHPGNDDLLTFISFVAPEAGFYRVFSNFNIQDINPSGVGINLILNNWNAPVITPLTIIDANSPFYEFKAGFQLDQGQLIGFGLDRAGSYFNDSTGVNFIVVSGIPEPTTWAMMIVGLGLIGWSLRRRGAIGRTSAAA